MQDISIFLDKAEAALEAGDLTVAKSRIGTFQLKRLVDHNLKRTRPDAVMLDARGHKLANRIAQACLPDFVFTPERLAQVPYFFR